MTVPPIAVAEDGVEAAVGGRLLNRRDRAPGGGCKQQQRRQKKKKAARQERPEAEEPAEEAKKEADAAEGEQEADAPAPHSPERKAPAAGEAVTPEASVRCNSSGEPLSSSPGERRGTGYGGVWTARDDFETRKRRTKWYRALNDGTPPKSVAPPPPRLYVDNRTIIREVVDVCELQRGDHCMIAINLVRSLSPVLDYIVSLMGSMELIYFYHHFIMVDDVASVDDQGIPRTKTGELAELVEYANTIPEALMEVKLRSLGSWRRWPFAAASFLLDKSRCQVSPLADYGDTKHLYKVIESVSLEDRERIVKYALEMVENPMRYNVFWNNCEHMSNQISRGHFTSPNMHFGVWSICRALLCVLGYVCLHVLGGACYDRFCVSRPLSALLTYHVLATAPVVLQALISFAMSTHTVWQQRARALISQDDFLHLVWKEFARMIVAGGGAVAAISLMPAMAWRTKQYFLTGVLCLVAYLAADAFYNVFAHIVMRAVLIPVWGKVWLLGSSDDKAKIKAKSEKEE